MCAHYTMNAGLLHRCFIYLSLSSIVRVDHEYSIMRHLLRGSPSLRSDWRRFLLSPYAGFALLARPDLRRGFRPTSSSGHSPPSPRGPPTFRNLPPEYRIKDELGLSDSLRNVRSMLYEPGPSSSPAPVAPAFGREGCFDLNVDAYTRAVLLMFTVSVPCSATGLAMALSRS